MTKTGMSLGRFPFDRKRGAETHDTASLAGGSVVLEEEEEEEEEEEQVSSISSNSTNACMSSGGNCPQEANTKHIIISKQASRQ